MIPTTAQVRASVLGRVCGEYRQASTHAHVKAVPPGNASCRVSSLTPFRHLPVLGGTAARRSFLFRPEAMSALCVVVHHSIFCSSNYSTKLGCSFLTHL